jgi:hypothetical protein
MVSDVAADRTISDPSHWAYPIFENFRRKYKNSKKTIVDIFEVKYKKGDSTCFIQWDEFIMKLEEQ